MIELERARWRLATIWFPGAGLVVLLLFGQSIGGAYGTDLTRVWGWALPNFIPTLGLMVSVFAAEALQPAPPQGVLVRRNFCTLSVWISAFYLALLLITILSQPLSAYLYEAEGAPLKVELLERSNIILGPIQGLVVTALGALFFLKEAAPGSPPAVASATSDQPGGD